MLAEAFSRACANLLMPGIVRIFLWCLLAYVVVGGVFAWVAGVLISSLTGAMGWEGAWLHWAGSLGGLMIAWFLFPLFYPVLMSFFDERMAEVIEKQDYPQLPVATPPFWPTFAQDMKFSLKAVLLNLLCLPLYFVPILGIGLYYGLNGYLLGVQFFRMSAGRRVGLAEAEALIVAHRSKIMLAGVGISISATIPVLNLAAPVLGVATLLHLFHLVTGAQRMEIIEP